VLVLAALDAAATAKELQERPWPFFLALVLSALGFAVAAYLAASRDSARRERDLYKQLHNQALERSAELKHERDDARGETDQERSRHMRDLVKILLAAEGLVRLKDDLERKLAELAKGVPK
jgi:hypothetical protein